jgi:transposase
MMATCTVGSVACCSAIPRGGKTKRPRVTRSVIAVGSNLGTKTQHLQVSSELEGSGGSRGTGGRKARRALKIGSLTRNCSTPGVWKILKLDRPHRHSAVSGYAALVLLIRNGLGSGSLGGCERSGGDARHLSPSAQEALRLRAVAALVAGRAREDVAAVFGVSLKAVDQWWAKWQAGGWGVLVMRPRGKPAGVHQVLGEAEQAAVRQAVLDHRPREAGLSGQLWTRRLVGELTTRLYRVRLTEVGVGTYLKRWRLSFRTRTSGPWSRPPRPCAGIRRPGP